MTKAQRDFLGAIATDALPIIFTDGAITVSVMAARLRFEARKHKAMPGRDTEETAELVLAKASGAAWDSAQAVFLRACGDDIKPLWYTHTDGKKRPCMLTRISWATPFKGPRGDEPVLQLRLVEARAGVWLSYAEAATVDSSVSIVLSDPLSPNVYGAGTFGYGAYG